MWTLAGLDQKFFEEHTMCGNMRLRHCQAALPVRPGPLGMQDYRIYSIYLSSFYTPMILASKV